MTPSFKSVIIKVTNECNLQCKYCFVSDSVPRRTVINEAIVELLLKELERVSSEETIHLVWHGGEPTLAGGEFFCRVKALQAGREKRFENYSGQSQTTPEENHATSLAASTYSPVDKQ